MCGWRLQISLEKTGLVPGRQVPSSQGWARSLCGRTLCKCWQLHQPEIHPIAWFPGVQSAGDSFLVFSSLKEANKRLLEIRCKISYGNFWTEVNSVTSIAHGSRFANSRRLLWAIEYSHGSFFLMKVFMITGRRLQGNTVKNLKMGKRDSSHFHWNAGLV